MIFRIFYYTFITIFFTILKSVSSEHGNRRNPLRQENLNLFSCELGKLSALRVSGRHNFIILATCVLKGRGVGTLEPPIQFHILRHGWRNLARSQRPSAKGLCKIFTVAHLGNNFALPQTADTPSFVNQ